MATASQVREYLDGAIASYDGDPADSDFQRGYLAALVETKAAIAEMNDPPPAELVDLDEWIEEHHREIAECPANAKGYRKACSLRWGLERLIEYRATLIADAPVVSVQG